jgi:DMSO reductase family type II enzyme heme b subunit
MQTPKLSLLWISTALALVGVSLLSAGTHETSALRGQAGRARSAPADAGVDLARAGELFTRQCAACHGPTGEGNGLGAYLLSPLPRDFTSGRFRLVSTQNGVPTDEDVVATLRRGMPGSAMPPFDWMGENDLRSLAAYVRKLAIDGKARKLLAQAEEDQEDLSTDEARKIATDLMQPGAPIEIGSPAPADAAGMQEGRRVFLKTCALCHGIDGKGRGVKDQTNEDGTPTQPRDFTAGVFKGGSSQADIVMRLRAGMSGSPMPAMSFDDPSQAWAVAAVVESMVEPGAQERVAQSRHTIHVRRVPGELPRDPADAAWNQAEPVWLAVAPLWWRDERIEGFVLRALHDGREIALRLSWEDQIKDDEILGQQTFADAAALQLSAQADPPIFTMGAKGEPVNIWQWKAAWERDLARVRDVADYRTETPSDAYGHVAAKDEAMYLTARAVGNSQAVGERTVAGAVLTAEGFGTLAPLAVPSDGFSTKGTWADGFWDVTFTRSMKPRDRAEVAMEPGTRVYLAGALYDGAHKDRNGQKSVTVWHVLEIEP